MILGGFKGITGRNIILDDGLFEVTLLKKPKNPLELQDMISSIITQKKCKNIISFKASKLKFYSEETKKWDLDGDYGGCLINVFIIIYKCAIILMTGMDNR